MGCGVEPGKRCTYCIKAGLATCTPKTSEPAKLAAKHRDKAIRNSLNK